MYFYLLFIFILYQAKSHTMDVLILNRYCYYYFYYYYYYYYYYYFVSMCIQYSLVKLREDYIFRTVISSSRLNYHMLERKDR